MEVARATWRAMMARAQAILPQGRRLPPYATGHENAGAPARDGTHRHIAVIVDPQRRRILFVSPTPIWDGAGERRSLRADHRLVALALAGMTRLRAGPAGWLALAPTPVDAARDPLFAPARVWESVGDYHVVRHRRGLAPTEALRADALAELRRCGRPNPRAVEVLAVRRGPRGGLAGRLRILFAAAQAGPLLLGRSAHEGGGSFGRSDSAPP